MLKLLRKRSTLGRTLVWAAIIALSLSFIGHLHRNFTQIPSEELTAERSVKVVLDTIPTAIKVFRAKANASPGTEGWILTIANTLGALVTFSAVLALLWAVLKEQVEKIRISTFRRHTILLGLDKSARLFLKSKQRPRDRAVVVVDPKASDKTRDRAHAEGCFHYATNEEREFHKRLSACSVHRADQIIISAGSDAENLEIFKELADADIDRPKDVILNVSDVKLHQQIEQNDAMMQSLGPNTSLRLFNYAKSAATDLLSRTNFTELATVQKQSRVSLCVFGATPYAAEVVTHYLRLSPSLLPQKPQITWVVQNKAALQKFLSLNYAPLANLIDNKDPTRPLSWALDLDVFETGEHLAPFDEGFLETLQATQAPPTALVVAEDVDTLGKTNIQIGGALRNTSRRISAFSVPIFIFSQKKGAEDDFFLCRPHDENARPVSQKKMSKTDDLTEVLEPFGRSDEVCNWGDADTIRENVARKIHQDYLNKRAEDADTNASRAASLAPWAELSETYKNANRRAADQLNALLYSKTVLTQHGNASLDKNIETLAALEHDAWWIDRELDGWKHNTIRDNVKKLHPDLIPYDDLPFEIQEYDRVKVRELFQ